MWDNFVSEWSLASVSFICIISFEIFWNFSVTPLIYIKLNKSYNNLLSKLPDTFLKLIKSSFIIRSMAQEYSVVLLWNIVYILYLFIVYLPSSWNARVLSSCSVWNCLASFAAIVSLYIWNQCKFISNIQTPALLGNKEWLGMICNFKLQQTSNENFAASFWYIIKTTEHIGEVELV